MESWAVGNRAEAQSLAPGARMGARRYPLTGVVFQHSLAAFHPAAVLAPPGDSPGRVHGNVRLSWLLFASANLKNAFVFPFGLGSLQQLPFMSIEPGTEAVGARGQ